MRRSWPTLVASFWLLASCGAPQTPPADTPTIAAEKSDLIAPATGTDSTELHVAEVGPPGVGMDAGPATAREEDPLDRVQTYVVEPGDSVRVIAQQFGVTNETIIWVNDLTDYDLLYVGQELKILPFSGLIHEIRPGDTVASLANAYEAKLDDVIRTNRLKEPYVVVVGQKLVVPGGYRPLPEKVVVSPTNEDDVVRPGPGRDGEQRTAAAAPVRSLPLRYGTPQDQFISSIAEAAVESHERTGVPASVTISQAILESYWGSSRLAREAQNYFGIKALTKKGPAGVVWFDVWEVIGGRNVVRSEGFRAYNTAAESFVDHGLFFLENGRYGTAMAARRDSRQFAREIARSGYATDPSYASKLIALMDKYDLYRFDE